MSSFSKFVSESARPNAKFKFTYTGLIFVACDAEPVIRGIGSGGVKHTNQIKPVHAVHTYPALRHGALFG